MKFNFGNIKVNGSPLTYFVELTALVFLFWIVFSGKAEAKFLILGVFFSIITAYICAPFLIVKNIKTGKEFLLFNINWIKFITYLIWLLGQIFLAAVDVTEATLGKKSAEPQIIYFKMEYENPAASALLANSIILTPGTITLNVSDEGIFEVHALTAKAADGVFNGEMQRKVAALFRESCQFIPMPENTVTEMPEEMD